ncbi:MAG: isoprenyl transferase [Bacteroidaceae bacterium]
MTDKEQLDKTKIPQHVAIIMDGNGRWAKAHGLNRSAGHQEGVNTVKNITEHAAEIGVKYLTLYTFSTENWNRPSDEVSALMGLILSSLEEELFMKNNIRFRAIGEIDRLPKAVKERITDCIEHTANNTKMTFVIALSYSSKWEITEAVKTIAERVKAGELEPQHITEASLSQELKTNFMPNPDLLIRTGGECRLSNYLLWQCAYSELYFCDTFWPDFNTEAFNKALLDYQKRERRFGKTSEQITNDKA